MKKSSSLKLNSTFEILTPEGFKDFKGIKKTTSSLKKTLTFYSGKQLSGSLDHPLIDTFGRKVLFRDIEKGTPNIFGEEVLQTTIETGSFDLFTVLGVEGEQFIVEETLVSSNCAFIPDKIFEEFYSSTYPTISAGEETKIIITSSANDINHFYELWKDANEGKNTYKPIEIKWSDVPGRNEAWKEQVISDIGQKRFNREFGNEFFGRSSVVIPLSLLKTLTVSKPLVAKEDLKIFEYPEKGGKYIAVVDVAEGKGDGDNSTIVIFKVPLSLEKEPYKVVFTFCSNEVPIFSFIETVFSFCTQYNEALLIPEVNIHDIASVLYRDYEYTNIIRTTTKRQKVASPFAQETTKLGIKTTASIKKLGLESLIQLFEQNLLEISDIAILKELTNLVRGRETFEAKSGCFDDLAICLILFAWSIREEGMADLVEIETQALKDIQENYVKQLYDELPDFFVNR